VAAPAAPSRSIRRFDAAALTLAVALAAAGILAGGKAVGGADSYGYASQAELWLKGRPVIDLSFAKDVPWLAQRASFKPLGYHAVGPSDGYTIGPTYAAGLPLLLAAGKLVGGQAGLFWVVPLFGGLLVLATYGIGRRLGMPTAGLVAAWLTATSPTVVYMSLVVMSDVPTAAVWAAAWWAALGSTRRSALAAGLLAGLAIMIRPNLAPLAALLGLRYAFDRLRGAAPYVAGLIPGVAFVALFNAVVYGSPLRSGYGDLSSLFDRHHTLTNAGHYLLWLAQSQTPLAIAGLVLLFAPVARLWPRVPDRRVLIAMAGFVAVLWAMYFPYLVFDSWWYLRFLLPSWPFILLGIGALV